MGVLRARVAHADGPSRVVAERALEDGAEDRGVDARPVEFLTTRDQDLVMNLLIQLGYLDALPEQAAVHVGEAGQQLAGVLRLSSLVVGVEPTEELDEGDPQARAVDRGDVVAEEPGLDQARVLAEHKAGAQHRQRVVDLLAVRVVVQIRNLVVDLAHDAARLDGNSTLDTLRCLTGTFEELQGGEVFGQVIQL